MPKTAIIIAVAALAIPVPAAASIVVLGGGAARDCYAAAASDAAAARAGLDRCDLALDQTSLTGQDRVATFVNRGILRIRTGDLSGALADFTEANELDPAEPEAYLNRGTALLRAEQAATALEMFNQALARNTRRPAIAYYHRGVAHETLGNIRAAYHDYRRASEADPAWTAPREELSRFRVVN